MIFYNHFSKCKVKTHMSQPQYLLTVSERPDKRFMIMPPDNNIIHFGGTPSTNPSMTDMNCDGFWDIWLGSHVTDVMKNVKEIERRFNVRITIL